jgi:hydrogenase maturation protease
MKTIVVGLGNPILGDDGVGWRVAEEVRQQLTSPPVPLLSGEGKQQIDVECLSLGGLSLMEHLVGYDRAILIDAFASDEDAGTIQVLNLSDMPNYSAFHISSAHDASLQSALEIGRSLGAHLPDDITVVGIASRRIYDFSEELSAPVADAITQVVKIVVNLLNQIVILR